MKIRLLFLGIAGASLLYSPAFSNDNWTCLNSVDGVEAFNSGDMKRASNYTEAEYGGVRVQREHPNTYMFAQAKFIRGEERNGAICQYSNHVGLVATYLILDVDTVDSIEGCGSLGCENKPLGAVNGWNPKMRDKKEKTECMSAWRS